MGRRNWSWVGVVLVLLIGGLLFSRCLPSLQTSSEQPSDSMAFRQWLWQSRGLDLAVQAGLILTGALAIAALLPRPGEAERGTAQDSTTQDEAR